MSPAEARRTTQVYEHGDEMTETVTDVLGSVIDTQILNCADLLKEKNHKRLSNKLMKGYSLIAEVIAIMRANELDYDIEL